VIDRLAAAPGSAREALDKYSSSAIKCPVVVMGIDGICIRDAAASIRSVVDTLRMDEEARIFLFVSDLLAKDIGKLRQSVTHSRAETFLIHLDTCSWGRLPRSTALGGKYSSTVYAPIFLGSLLPDSCERVIWLDADTITRRSLVDLWNLDLGSSMVGAVGDDYVHVVSDPWGVAHWRELGLDVNARYFNSGVMLIDLSAWRGYGVEDRALDYLESYGDSVVQHDQDALNVICAGLWSELDVRWNVTNYWRLASRRVGSCADILETAYIRHFAGPLKPGRVKVEGVSDVNIFYDNLDRTAWCGWRPS
jgi:lipopolysaccharide biosynthesis glycosyltransferase